MKLLSLMLTVAVTLCAEVTLPDYSTHTLPNGAVLHVLQKKDVPMATLRAVFRGGAETDPADKAGLASVTAEMLRRGTASRSAAEFSEELDFMGATFSASVSRQATTISTEFLSKDLETALDLFADAIINPSFPKDEADKLLKQRIDAVKMSKDNMRALVSRHYRSFFYPKDHPYSQQATGDELTLAAIGRDDIAAAHKRMYAGKNLTLIAAGDIDAATARERIAAAFANLPEGEAYRWVSKVPALDRKAPRLLLVDKPDATQTFFMIGQPGISRTHPDRDAIVLVNTLFGGRFTSMLNDELRVNAGLTYGAYSIVERDRLQGSIAILTYTGTETTERAVDLALDLLKRLHTKGIDQEMLDSARAYVKGLFPTRSIETADQLARVLGDLAVFDLDRDEIDKYFDRLDAVTVERANAAIKEHYRLDNLQMVMVGDASKIKNIVEKYADDMTTVSP